SHAPATNTSNGPCLSCSHGWGRCFGRAVCCHPHGGCRVGFGPDTAACRRLPAKVLGCGRVATPCLGGKGRCASRGICCTADSCETTNECKDVKFEVKR
uniref:GRANULINS domain-containing protein n=1 Tax=Macrostomum lignano TaxID=282301 RepID=A0A1I8IKP1_9PLAT